MYQYKEYLFLDDENQYLRRFYPKQENVKRLQKILRFYKKKFSPPAPVLPHDNFERYVMKRNKKLSNLFYQHQNNSPETSSQLKTPTSLAAENITDSEQIVSTSQILKDAEIQNPRDQRGCASSNDSDFVSRSNSRNNNSRSSSNNRLPSNQFSPSGNLNSNKYSPNNEGERLPTLQSDQNPTSVKLDSVFQKSNNHFSFLKDLQKAEESISFESTVHDIYNPQFTEQDCAPAGNGLRERFARILKSFNIHDYEIALTKSQRELLGSQIQCTEKGASSSGQERQQLTYPSNTNTSDQNSAPAQKSAPAQ